MTIMMPVEALAPICTNCPDLSIDITRISADVHICNVLRCTYYERCLRIKENLEKERNEKRD